MQVLVIGSGGREHALAWKAAQDKDVTYVYVCPGNAGTALEEKVRNIKVDINDFTAIEIFCVLKNIGLVIIGPEQPLVDGLSDFLQSKGIKTFGPSQAAAQLEYDISQIPENTQHTHSLLSSQFGNPNDDDPFLSFDEEE